MSPFTLKVLNRVAAEFFVAPEAIIGISRQPRHVEARAVFYRVLVESGGNAVEIAQEVGRNHTTVYYCAAKAKRCPVADRLIEECWNERHAERQALGLWKALKKYDPAEMVEVRLKYGANVHVYRSVMKPWGWAWEAA